MRGEGFADRTFLGENRLAGKTTALQMGYPNNGEEGQRTGCCPARLRGGGAAGTYLLLLGAELRGHAARRGPAGPAGPG